MSARELIVSVFLGSEPQQMNAPGETLGVVDILAAGAEATAESVASLGRFGFILGVVCVLGSLFVTAAYLEEAETSERLLPRWWR